METILLKAEKVTPRYIKQLKEKYNLSWSELHRYCNYDARGNALLNAVRDPETYLTPLMQKKILRGVAKLEKEKGHVHEVTSLVKFIPKRFRITKTFEVCKGHREYCTSLDKNGFCDAECKELFNAKREKRK